MNRASDSDWHHGSSQAMRRRMVRADVRVDDSGTIAIPLLGQVGAAGLANNQLSGRISEQRVQRELFRSTGVSAEVPECRPIFVPDEVSNPGRHPFQPGMTVLSAVSVAGGSTCRALADIVRTDGNTSTEGRITRQALIRPGDAGRPMCAGRGA